MSWVFAKVSRVVFVHFPGSSRVVFQGVKSVICLALSAVINIFVPKPAFYIHQSISRQPFFEGDKTKQKFWGTRGKAILDEALRRFGVQVWWSGACTLTIFGVGWHSSENLSKIEHYTVRGFDAAGNMVFTAELANRLVDSAAWVYTANQTKETFDTNDYARVIPPGRINGLVVRKLKVFARRHVRGGQAFTSQRYSKSSTRGIQSTVLQYQMAHVQDDGVTKTGWRLKSRRRLERATSSFKTSKTYRFWCQSDSMPFNLVSRRQTTNFLMDGMFG
ncbi:hypothetical protein EV421DRAFT_1733432 [Armillaria borealis]|uniref:Uncharacterized protein n=1 Tax=Armillaria borealis TaxID=47425 RepID=A0AA39JS97_9AGAR|nr:hypothetical protein EV421DRAFT_1733432 [Armillaria borealis]